jgi:sulfate adenylyltransferase subunit 1
VGEVTLQFQQALPLAPYAQSRSLGALILVDTAHHSTAAAALVS